MADTFVPITFVADELLTSTKMNLLAANQAGFHDGTALGDGIIVTRHIANAGITEAKQVIKSSYSTGEVDTGVKWVDGKAVYKRTFTGTITQAVNTRNNTTLVASGIDKVIQFSGWYDEGGGLMVASGSQRMDVSGVVNGSDTVWVTGGLLAWLSKSSAARTNAPYAITIYYTKI
jgi:hypothetical protein